MDLGQYGVSLKKIKKTLCSVIKLSYCFAMQSPWYVITNFKKNKWHSLNLLEDV